MSNKNGHLIQAVCPFFQLALIMFPRHPISRIHRLYEDEGYEPLARVDGTGPLKKIRYYHNFQANGARLTWSRVQSSIATFKTFKGYFLQATTPCVIAYGYARIRRLVRLGGGR